MTIRERVEAIYNEARKLAHGQEGWDGYWALIEHHLDEVVLDARKEAGHLMFEGILFSSVRYRVQPNMSATELWFVDDKTGEVAAKLINVGRSSL